jgi:3-phenylpropionate/cinnamic acid dioxygenase small subunit
MEAWELVAREQIRDTIARYAHCVDGGRFDDLGELFVPDGVLEIEGAPPHRGRAAITAFVAGVGRDLAASAVPRIRHHVGNVVIELDGTERARSRCYFLAVTDRGVDHWGRYRDELVPWDGRWRFARRQVRTDGATRGSWAAGRAPT